MGCHLPPFARNTGGWKAVPVLVFSVQVSGGCPGASSGPKGKAVLAPLPPLLLST